MSLHQEYVSPTQRASNDHRRRFFANINAQVGARNGNLPDHLAFGPITGFAPPDEQAFGPVVCDKPPEPEAAPPTCLEIIKATAKYFKIAKLHILSDRRETKIVRPRQMAMYLCHTLTPNSLPEIGRQFGATRNDKRDHTTVLHSTRAVQGRMCAGDAITVAAYDFLTKQLGAA